MYIAHTMRRKIPSLQALACLDAAARHESYTRAAQELALTQGAVSRQITALEEFMGMALSELRLHTPSRRRTAAGAGTGQAASHVAHPAPHGRTHLFHDKLPTHQIARSGQYRAGPVF